jgi:hypothetical protein
MRRIVNAFALIAAAALPLTAQQRQTDASFKWSGRVPSGHWMRIENMNGSVTVGQASGDNVEVTATKTWRRGDPALVRIETKSQSDGSVMVCALWDDRTSCDDRASNGRDDHRHSGRNNRDNDVSVEFHVLVPRGVKIDAATVNGSVTVDGAASDVEAATVNGEVDVATSGGHVNATNVNGGVRARLGRVDPDGSMEFTTVNGSVIVELPSDFGADVDMSTLSGSLNTNFEMTLRGRMDPHHLRTHVGRPGGPRIKLVTINGGVELRKR